MLPQAGARGAAHWWVVVTHGKIAYKIRESEALSGFFFQAQIQCT